MTNPAAFDDVTRALLADPDDDVTLEGTSLLVKGSVFAALDGELLVVALPAHRADDLLGRDVATPAEAPSAAAAGVAGRWVGIADTQNWVELATEAHQFVGEPAVGGDS